MNGTIVETGSPALTTTIVVHGGANNGIDAVWVRQLLGNTSITNTSISGGIEDNVRVLNTSGTLNRVTFDNVAIGPNDATFRNDGISIEMRGTAVIHATVTKSVNRNARRSLPVCAE